MSAPISAPQTSALCPRTTLLFALVVLVITSSVLFAVMLIAIPLPSDARLFLLLRRSWRIAGAVLLCCAQLVFLALFVRSNVRWWLVGVVCWFVLLSAWTILATLLSPIPTARRRSVATMIGVFSAAVLATGVILVANITSTPPTPRTPPMSPRFRRFLQIEKTVLSLRHMDKRNRNAADVLDSPGLLAQQIIEQTKTRWPPLTTCLFELDNLVYVDQVTQQMNALCARENSPYPFEGVETLSIVNCRYNTFFDERSVATPTAFSTLSSMPALTTLGVHFPEDADRKTDAYTPINDVALLHHCVGKSWPTRNKITTVDCSDNAIMMQALVTPSTAMHEKMQSLFIEVVKAVLSQSAVSSFCWRRCALGTLSTEDIQTIARLFDKGLSAVRRSTTIQIGRASCRERVYLCV